MPIDRTRRTLSLDPHDPVFYADPYAAYRAMRATAGPAIWRQELGHWCLLGFDEVNAALRDRRLGREILHVASRTECGLAEPLPHLAAFDAVEAHSLLEREPPVHTRLRGLVNRAFTSRAIAHLRPRIERLAHELVDGFAATGEVELIQAYATPIPITLIAELLGVPAAAAPDLLAWSHAMVRMYQPGRTRADEERAEAATGAFVAFLKDWIAQRRRQPADDLITALLAAEAQGDRLSEPELISTCILLLNAGHEATVHAIGNGVLAILQSGLDPGRLVADEAATAATVEELLRFEPPLHLFTRWVLEDATIAGIPLRRGQRIGLLLAAANRDPARFVEPDRLDPARQPAGHVSFSAGIHFCLGAPLARLELQIALPILFQRLPGLRLAEQPRWRDSWHFRGLEALHLRW